jgi:CRISPR-associated protein Cas6
MGIDLVGVDPVVDLAFPVRGVSIPSDHVYLLYGAVSTLIPAWHEAEGGMARIGGLRDGAGKLHLRGGRGWLRFRVPSRSIALLLPLAGKVLDLEGDRLTLGVPRTHLLRPAAALVAPLVTIKGFQEEGPFAEACGRQLVTLGVEGEVTVSQRGVVRVKGRTVVGFRTLVSGLTAEDSIRLQEHGLGGRRKLGCGVFGPARKSERP